MHTSKIRIALAALASIGVLSAATADIATARAPVHRLGQVATVKNGHTKVVYMKGGSTGDPGSASDAQCEKIAAGITSWQNAAVQSWESSGYNITDEVSHDLQNAKDLENDGLDQGCFFYS